MPVPYSILAGQQVLTLKQSGQIMPQLVFHGKKTVPAAIRRDMWRPYFAVHFPETDVGAKAGLTAYQRLREFALRRQLSPPPEQLIATEKDYEDEKKRKGDPVDVREQQFARNMKLPFVGQRLPKKLRAKRLMDQRATSVADLAFVLLLARRSFPRLEKELKVPLEERDQERLKLLGRKGRKRLRAIRADEKEQEKEITERQTLVETVDVNKGKMPLDKKVAEQLSIEYDGAVTESNRVINLADMESAKNSLRQGPRDIQVLWADVRDGTYAAEWPEGVFHQELQPVVTSKRAEMRIRQHGGVDEEGYMIEQQKGPISAVTGSSPHIIGREMGPGYKPLQQVIKEKEDTRRELRKTEEQELKEKENQRRELQEAEVARLEREKYPVIRPRYIPAADSFDALVSDPTYVALARDEENNREKGKPLLTRRQAIQLSEFRRRQSQLLDNLEPLRRLELKYPELVADSDLREYWELCNEPDARERLEAILDGARSMVRARRAQLNNAQNPSTIEHMSKRLKSVLKKAMLHKRGVLEDEEARVLEEIGENVARDIEQLRQESSSVAERTSNHAQVLPLDAAEVQLNYLPPESTGQVTYEMSTEQGNLDSRSEKFSDLSLVLDKLGGKVQEAIWALQTLPTIPKEEDITPEAFSVTLALDESYVKERDVFIGKRHARGEEIKEVEKVLGMQGRAARAATVASDDTTASTTRSSTANEDNKKSSSDAEDITLLKNKLSILLAAQDADRARLSELREGEYEKFAQNSDHINIAQLLPKHYREDKYWPEELRAQSGEVEEVRTELVMGAPKVIDEEQKRMHEAHHEESRGFVSRLGGRIGGLFRSKRE